ncbi:hypothetical protein C8Q77DRAFT_1180533 [Trametes polyzona]|nr:hypothetical protein C8Q77DRAFT_1180533 [Trametes polyzona]
MPVPYTENSAQTFGFDQKTADAQNYRRGEEMTSFVIGPMPVDAFLNEFLDARKVDFKDMPSPNNAFDSVLPETKAPTKERDIYEPLIRAINDDGTGRSRCPGFYFLDTSDKPDTSGGPVGSKKPDICCYAERHLGLVKKDKLEDSLVAQTNMGLAATFIEVKLDAQSDCFRDPPGRNPSKKVRKGWKFALHGMKGDPLLECQKTLGQNGTYASEIGMRQFRDVTFSLMMFGLVVRLVRWDRSGAIVSAAFDIHTHPEYLCKFLWCFSHVSDIQRGYELTVEPASLADEARFKESIEAHIQSQLPWASEEERRAALDEHYAEGNVTIIYVLRQEVDRDGTINTIHPYLISRPVYIPLTLVGRCTRRFWAVDTVTGQVVFLKDTWRSNDDDREGSILQILEANAVRNVPPLVYHCDVSVATILGKPASLDDFPGMLDLSLGVPQKTLTQDYLDRDWLCGSPQAYRTTIIGRTRYRLIVRYAGYPLIRCRGTRELFNGTFGAFIAMYDAYKNCGFMHCDITPGNIILYTMPEMGRRIALLTDWELALHKTVEDDRKYRLASMSWQFLSVALLSGTRSQHRIADDMESLYYVILYCALLYLPHKLNNQQLIARLNNVFDYSDTSADRHSNGQGKSHDLTITGVNKLPWTGSVRDWFEAVTGRLAEYFFRRKQADWMGAHKAWNLDVFLEIWVNTLVRPGVALPEDDRIDRVNDKKNLYDFKKVVPRSVRSDPYQATIAHDTVEEPHSATTIGFHTLSRNHLGATTSGTATPRRMSETGPHPRPWRTEVESSSLAAARVAPTSAPGRAGPLYVDLQVWALAGRIPPPASAGITDDVVDLSIDGGGSSGSALEGMAGPLSGFSHDGELRIPRTTLFLPTVSQSFRAPTTLAMSPDDRQETSAPAEESKRRPPSVASVRSRKRRRNDDDDDDL